MSRYIDADKLMTELGINSIDCDKCDWGNGWGACKRSSDFVDCCVAIEDAPTADVRDYATAHKVVGGGERDGATCWFECDNCGLAVDVGDVFCKHCGARFVP